MKTMRVVGYVRVSTEEQSTSGISLEAQRSKVEGYARLYDLVLVDVVVDAGQSAKTLARPGLSRALGMLDAGSADGVLVAKLDRLTRSVADLAALLDGYFGERPGKQLFSVGDAIDTRTAAGRLVLNVLMSVAQWERETIVERTRDAMRHKKGRGERVGQVPFGSDLAEDGRTLVPNPGEIEVLGRIRGWRAAGWALRRIAAELTHMGIPSKNGGPHWTHTTVAGIVRQKETRLATEDRPSARAEG